MRILFMGSAELACPSLRRLLEGGRDEVVGVVSQPDRPRGRHLRMQACPVKALAEGRGLLVLTPEKASEPDAVEQMRLLSPDLIVLAAYGQILKPPVLALPRVGAINLHPSLLPRYRGAAPIQWALARGETVTGVTILHISERMDAGDLILQEPHPIGAEDTAGILEPALAEHGAELLARALESIREDRAPRVAQDEALVTLAPKLKKEDGRIRWAMAAEEIRNRVRAFNPWPGGYFEAGADHPGPVRVLVARVEEGRGRPGEILSIEGEGPLVASGRDAVRLAEVQPSGKKAMPGAAWLRGHRLQIGDALI